MFLVPPKQGFKGIAGFRNMPIFDASFTFTNFHLFNKALVTLITFNYLGHFIGVPSPYMKHQLIRFKKYVRYLRSFQKVMDPKPISLKFAGICPKLG